MKNTSKKNEKNKYTPVFSLLFYLMGITGILCGFTDIFGGSVKSFIIPFIIVSAVLIFLFSHNRKAYIVHILLFFIAFGLFAYIKRYKLIPYAENVFFALTDSKSLRNYDISYLMLALAVFSGELISLFTFIFKKTRCFFVFITAVLLLCAFIAKSVSAPSVVLIMLSVCGLHILNINVKSNIVICIFSAALVLAAFLFSNMTVSSNNELLCDAADSVESFLNDNINKLVYNRGIDYDSGKVNRGNNHQTGRDALELWLSAKPEEDLYLRGFSGGEYKDGQWEEADESAFFTQISTERGWSRWGNLVDTTYKEIFYNANSISDPDVLRRGRRITINPVTGGIKNRYYPYIERWERLTRKQNIAYVYSYYELKDLNIIHENLFGQVLRVYDDMQKNYEPYVYKTYLNVPSGLDRLKALCQSADINGADDAIAFVQSTLSENAQYTLKPGIAPLGDDIVEYFLFENKKGYCVHFASAGTLMFRMLGIPARYVTGYRVNKGLFFKQEDGDYYAAISDRYAHAWCEIYVRDKGWIPIEVTPSISNITSSEIDENANRQETSTEESTLTAEETKEESTYTAARDSKDHTVPIIVPLAAIMLFAAARRILLINRLKNSSVRKLFAMILDITAFFGKRLNGLEKDFAQRLTELIPAISSEEAERLVKTVYAEAYGGIRTGESDRLYVLNIYNKAARYVCKNSNILKKLYIRVVKVWL